MGGRRLFKHGIEIQWDLTTGLEGVGAKFRGVSKQHWH